MLWLAAMLLALRALLPTGFMPDPGALRAGRFELVYCNAWGPMPVGMAMAAHRMAPHGIADPGPTAEHAGHGAADALGMAGMQNMGAGGHAGRMRAMSAGVQANRPDNASHPDRAPAAPDGSGMPADCPFGLTGAYTSPPALPVVVAPIRALAWRIPPPPLHPSPPPGVTAGPPVGSRAPPSSLA